MRGQKYTMPWWEHLAGVRRSLGSRPHPATGSSDHESITHFPGPSVLIDEEMVPKRESGRDSSSACLSTFFQELLFNMSDIFLPSLFLSIYSLLCKCFSFLGFMFRLQGLADYRLRSTSVSLLLLSIKFCWNTDTPFCLHIVCDRVVVTETICLSSLKYLFSGFFTEKYLLPLYR